MNCNSPLRVKLDGPHIDGPQNHLWIFDVRIQVKYYSCNSCSCMHLGNSTLLLEVCKSDPNPIQFVRISEQKYTFRIGLIKLFRSRIGSDFDIRNKMN